MDFGQRLKNLRLERGYTQQDLSSAVGVSTVAVRSWEHNTKKPNMDALIALGRFLNTSIDTLLDIQPKGSEQNYTFILSPAEKRFQGLTVNSSSRMASFNTWLMMFFSSRMLFGERAY